MENGADAKRVSDEYAVLILPELFAEFLKFIKLKKEEDKYFYPQYLVDDFLNEFGEKPLPKLFSKQGESIFLTRGGCQVLDSDKKKINTILSEIRSFVQRIVHDPKHRDTIIKKFPVNDVSKIETPFLQRNIAKPVNVGDGTFTKNFMGGITQKTTYISLSGFDFVKQKLIEKHDEMLKLLHPDYVVDDNHESYDHFSKMVEKECLFFLISFLQKEIFRKISSDHPHLKYLRSYSLRLNGMEDYVDNAENFKGLRLDRKTFYEHLPIRGVFEQQGSYGNQTVFCQSFIFGGFNREQKRCETKVFIDSMELKLKNDEINNISYGNCRRLIFLSIFFLHDSNGDLLKEFLVAMSEIISSQQVEIKKLRSYAFLLGKVLMAIKAHRAFAELEYVAKELRSVEFSTKEFTGDYTYYLCLKKNLFNEHVSGIREEILKLNRLDTIAFLSDKPLSESSFIPFGFCVSYSQLGLVVDSQKFSSIIFRFDDSPDDGVLTLPVGELKLWHEFEFLKGQLNVIVGESYAKAFGEFCYEEKDNRYLLMPSFNSVNDDRKSLFTFIKGASPFKENPETTKDELYRFILFSVYMTFLVQELVQFYVVLGKSRMHVNFIRFERAVKADSRKIEHFSKMDQLLRTWTKAMAFMLNRGVCRSVSQGIVFPFEDKEAGGVYMRESLRARNGVRNKPFTYDSGFIPKLENTMADFTRNRKLGFKSFSGMSEFPSTEIVVFSSSRTDDASRKKGDVNGCKQIFGETYLITQNSIEIGETFSFFMQKFNSDGHELFVKNLNNFLRLRQSERIILLCNQPYNSKIGDSDFYYFRKENLVGIRKDVEVPVYAIFRAENKSAVLDSRNIDNVIVRSLDLFHENLGMGQYPFCEIRSDNSLKKGDHYSTGIVYSAPIDPDNKDINTDIVSDNSLKKEIQDCLIVLHASQNYKIANKEKKRLFKKNPNEQILGNDSTIQELWFKCFDLGIQLNISGFLEFVLKYSLRDADV
ncbi:MAG: hypothetical protein HQM12_18245 [SAR324 cluster bacterium]|nr:hypothetical protein [SAR324 cluster bacterium]